MTDWIVGDVSASTTLTDNDHLYPTHINQLRVSMPHKAIVGTATNSQYQCDGTADDIEIQAAIDDVNTAGGGEVYLREGTYNLSNNNNQPAFLGSTPPYCGIILKNKVKLVGAGMGKTILNCASFVSGTNELYRAIVNSAAGQTEIEVRDLTITLPAGDTVTPYWGTGIWFTGVSRVLIENVRITNGNWNLAGSSATFSTTTKELTTNAEDNVVRNVICDSYIGSCSIQTNKNFIVDDCKFYESHDDALIIYVAAQHGVVNDCIFDQKNATGGAATALIYLLNDASLDSDIYAISDIVITGGVTRRHGLGNGISLQGTKNIKIIGHTSERNTGRGIYDGGGGAKNENTFITDCIISHNTSNGIQMGGGAAGGFSNDLVVMGNTIFNNTGSGVAIGTSVASGTRSNTVMANEIYDDQGVATQTTGINIAAINAVTTEDVIVEGNNIHDTTTPINLQIAAGGTITGIIRNNRGYITENSGTGTIANGATSAVITHGLSVTPTLQDIIITLGENPTNTPGAVWVDTIGATQFTVNCENDPGASALDFAWKAIVTRTSYT